MNKTAENIAPKEIFRFKQFAIAQDKCTMKIGTDGVLLGAWASVENAAIALDIGAGSGVIAIMLGQRNPTLEVHAVEIDEASAAQCADNMKSAPWASRLSVHGVSLQHFAAQTDVLYDLVVSNPPFFSGGTFSSDENRNNVRHTVKLPHGDLLGAAKKLLSPKGRFCVILPYIEGLRFAELAENYHLYLTKMTEVRPLAQKSVERLLLQFELSPKILEKDELVIQYEKRNDWTAAYKALTGDFYLKI